MNTVTSTCDKENMRCLMYPEIPEGKLSMMTIWYLKGDKDRDAIGIFFGVSKENHNTPYYLGGLTSDWSISLFIGWTHHDEFNREMVQDQDGDQ